MKLKFFPASIVALTVMCLIFMACSRGVEPWGIPAFTGEVYGVAWGYEPGVRVTLTLHNGVITSARLDLRVETETLITAVPVRIPPLIYETNGFNFVPNVITGTTRTVEGIIKAGTEALLKIDGVEIEDIPWQWQPIEGQHNNWFVRPFPGQY